MTPPPNPIVSPPIVAKFSGIRSSIRTGKVPRSRADGSLRFDFSSENVAEIAAHSSTPDTSRSRGRPLQ